MGLLKTCLLGEAAAGEGASFDAAKEFDAKELVKVLEVHRCRKFIGEGFPKANHIIRQDEDKAKLLLYAITFRRQDADRWAFNEFSCLRKDLG